MITSRRLGGPLASILMFALTISSAPTGRAATLDSLVESNTAFGLNLYGEFASTPGNIFFSPYSISTCLAMLYAGAQGDTETQMAQVLGVASGEDFASLFGELQLDVESDQLPNAIQLNVANALWTQESYPFLPSFLGIASNQFQASINQADFETQAAAVTQTINNWVAQETQNKIQNILPAGSIDALTRLVLANAIYFKGTWATTFEPSNTLNEPFYLAKTTRVDAQIMHQPTLLANYMETEQFQALELPYASNQLSMVILLPSQIDGIGQMEEQLSPAFLSGVLGQMSPVNVNIFLPKFTLESYFDLGGTLAELGMPDAFTPGVADFAGIDGTTFLYITHVFHKAWGEVDEQGTEAAAATVITVGTEAVGVPLPPPRIFRADHPFIFFIRDTQSGSVLFFGRLANPNPSGDVSETIDRHGIVKQPRIVAPGR